MSLQNLNYLSLFPFRLPLPLFLLKKLKKYQAGNAFIKLIPR